MKKVGIITFQESGNYGALLQAYALKTTIEKFGHSAEIINYHCEAKELQYSMSISRHFSLLGNINMILSNAIIRQRKARFDQFREDYLRIDSKALNKSSIESISDLYDIFICGSDQVWNPNSTKGDATYFLDFVKEKNKCFSYAASIALSSIPDQYVKLFTDGVNHMNRISVREETGKKLVRQMTGRDVTVDLDPTLLLSGEDWKRISDKLLSDKKYIFLYMVGFSQDAVNVARMLSKKYRLPVLMPVKTIKDYKYGFHGFVGGPIEFLTMIRNAEYVVTTSFHGMMFSLTFHKNFFVVEKPSTDRSTASRIDDFLSTIEINNRKYDGNIDMINDIDYSTIDVKIDRLRNKSKKFLEECFQ